MTKINNLPEYASEYKFIVAREDDNGEYWFWGAYDTDYSAINAMRETGGRIFINEIR